MQLQPVAIDIHALVSDVIVTMQPAARAKELQLILDLASVPEEVVTDSLRLQQIVTNLMTQVGVGSTFTVMLPFSLTPSP